MKLISIRVKELFEPITLSKKGDGLKFFLSAFSDLEKRFLSNAIGDFTLKIAELGRKSVFN